MSTLSIPPKLPVTTADLEIFRDRTRFALTAVGLSQRQAEQKIGMATGTISKLYTGKIQLKLATIRELASLVGVGPETLVEGTGLAHLLLDAPTTLESEQLNEVHAELDRLRAKLAVRDATVLTLEEAAQSARVERERITRQLAAEVRKGEDLAKTVNGLRAQQVTDRSTARSLELARASAAISLIQVKAQLVETERQTIAWREHALARHQRVAYLETELAKQLAASARQSAEETGRLFLSAAAGFGIGTLVTPKTAPPPLARRPAGRVAARRAR